MKVRNIILTGFMGTGKSTIGRLLSKEAGLKPVDLDELIEKEAGMPIRDIFSSRGEGYFRELEAGVIKRLAAGAFGEGLAVSTGGGAVIREENRSLLKGWGVLVCLSASIEEIIRRVGDRPERPLIAGPDKREAAERMLKEREGAYADCDIRVDTTGLGPEEVVTRIITSIGHKKS